MKVLIVEDEKPAAEKLERYIKQYDEGIEIIGRLDSVQKVTDWFNNEHPEVDLLFMDIQLTDGYVFDVFKQVSIAKPVIFTTAFSEYAIEAFKVSGIDYLLKPITYEAVAGSLKKLDILRTNLAVKNASNQLQVLAQALTQLQKKNYKNRFMVRVGEHIQSVTADQIAFFYAIDRDVFLYTAAKKKYIIDYKLEELEEILDPELFFRVNRSFILHINAVSDVLMYSNSRLKIHLHQAFDKEIIVSRERVALFKEWFNGLS